MSKERQPTPEKYQDAPTVIRRIEELLAENNIHGAYCLCQKYHDSIGMGLGLEVRDQTWNNIYKKRTEVVTQINQLIDALDLAGATALANVAFTPMNGELTTIMRKINKMTMLLNPAEYVWEQDLDFMNALDDYSDQQREIFANYLRCSELTPEDKTILATGDYIQRIRVLKRLWEDCHVSTQLTN